MVLKAASPEHERIAELVRASVGRGPECAVADQPRRLRTAIARPRLSAAMGAGAEAPREPDLPAALVGDGAPVELAHDDAFAELALGDVDLSGQRANGVDMRAASLEGTDLSGSELAQLGLVDVTLRGCDLANLTAPRCSWMRVRLETCRMTGLSLSGGQLRAAVAGTTGKRELSRGLKTNNRADGDIVRADSALGVK